MAKESNSRIASLLSRVFRFQDWLDVSRIKKFTQYIIDLAKRLFVPRPQEPDETFKEASSRLKLTDEALLKRKQSLFRMSMLMVLFAGLLLFYGIYQMLYGSILGVLLTLVVISIALALAFRYHFWYFQVKEKRLGCSWKTWLNEGLLGGKKS